jgi:hypothetical protein
MALLLSRMAKEFAWTLLMDSKRRAAFSPAPLNSSLNSSVYSRARE